MLDIDFDLLDDDGYPTDEAIEYIENFRGTPQHLTTLIADLWHLYDIEPVSDPETGHVTVELVTCGWSGNESIISALNQTSYRLLGWQSSERGGRHVYEFGADFWTSEAVWPFPKRTHACPECGHISPLD
ncbi:hypothetical protein [Aeromicrobium sp. 179-A 4D2 NHS]|uniref:hypothetical protein n=1 Tax=Aeromicrobium sp. 179-A 4D2 NHS TaxID=3142375 RepID=UPI0039A1E5D2